MPVALSTLALVMLLTAWVASNSEHLGRTSETDRRSKRALGATDAGIQAASHMLESLRPTNAECVISPGVRTAFVSGQCSGTPANVSLGDGTTYRYVVSPVLATGATCAGVTTVAGARVRCVTTSGTVAGVARRGQARLTARTVVSMSPTGIVGRTRVDALNSVEFATCSGDPQASIGSNGTIALNNSIKLRDPICGTSRSWNLARPAEATVSLGISIDPSTPTQTVMPEPWDPPAIDPWPVAAETNNSLLTAGTGRTWDAVNRELTITGSYTLPAGTFSICSLIVGNGATLNLDGETRLFIDSPTRAGSGCRSGTGSLRAVNSNGINWPSSGLTGTAAVEAAKRLTVFVHGSAHDNPGAPTYCSDPQAWGSVVLCNSAGFAGMIYAPNSRVYLGNSIEFAGAIVGDRVVLNNSVKFRLTPGLMLNVPTSSYVFGQKEWTECPAAGAGESC
jgi:hypothetical protein